MSHTNVNTHDLDVVCNNGFIHIFNCCWRESVRPLQYFCKSVPYERRLISMRKLLYHDNPVLRMLASLLVVYCEYISLCSQYAIKDPFYSRMYVRECLECFL